MATNTETLTEDALNSQYLSNSISSLSSGRSQASLVTKTYRHATQFYLTRRLKEALEAIEPIVAPQVLRSGIDEGQSNGHTSGQPPDAPIASASVSRTTRVKIWLFYLSLLNAIVELGPEQGKVTLGSTVWRAIAAKAREGTIWQDVVANCYHGEEGDVDGEVVANLATLLLSHMSSQRLTQTRLETYLSSSPAPSAAMEDSVHFNGNGRDRTHSPNPASNPKELATRLKLLELYVLHVLPANSEWEYAHEFVTLNDTLDDEHKEAYQQTLQNLKDEHDGTAQRERELAKQREREMVEQRKIDEARTAAKAREEEKNRKVVETERQRPASARSNGSAASSSSKAANIPAKSTSTAAPNGHNGHPKPAPSQVPSHNAKPASRKPPSPPPGILHRASNVLHNLRRLVMDASRSLTGSPILLLRFVMFLVAFGLIIGRRDLREKMKRAWDKVKATVGMGVKVSYI